MPIRLHSAACRRERIGERPRSIRISPGRCLVGAGAARRRANTRQIGCDQAAGDGECWQRFDFNCLLHPAQRSTVRGSVVAKSTHDLRESRHVEARSSCALQGTEFHHARLHGCSPAVAQRFRMADETITTTGIAAHGASRLPSVDVDSFNIELADEEGFLGDRASKGSEIRRRSVWEGA
jgi:hypothetical protein